MRPGSQTTNDDDIAFGERSQCFQDHFEQPWLKKEPLLNVSSALGEIVADSGGIKFSHSVAMASRARDEAALRAALGDDVSYDQLFFYALAHFWCGQATDVASKVMALDVHPPGEARVNGGLSNFPAFAEAFQCSGDDQMVQPNICELW